MKSTALTLLLVAAGCSGGKAPVDDDVALIGADVKADLPANSKFLGSYQPGQKIPLVSYTRKPRYRTLSFQAQAGLIADVRVLSTDGDPVAWLLDSTGQVLGFNDDESDTSRNSRIKVTLPPANGFYYVVMREYSLHAATFQVSVQTYHTPDNAGSAQEAYDLASDHLDDYKIDASTLPAAASAQFQGWNARWPNATAYRLDTQSLGTLYVVADSLEEQYWVDVYDANGALLAHGYSGDSCCQITSWTKSPYDPSQTP